MKVRVKVEILDSQDEELFTRNYAFAGLDTAEVNEVALGVVLAMPCIPGRSERGHGMLPVQEKV